MYRFLPVSFLMKLSGKKVILPFYHFVINKENKLVNHLYQPKNKTEFIEDITFFKKHFSTISVPHLNEKNRNNNLGFMLSFDDGLSNFYDVVAPILIKEKVHAINFLNSNFIDNTGLFYRYKVNILIDYIQDNVLSKNQETTIKKMINTDDFNTRLVKRKLKSLSIKDNNLIDEVAKVLNISFDDFLKNETPYLSTNQVVDLMDKGFLFGAHSKNHPRYSLISLNEQLQETIDSISVLKTKFNLKSNYFSFPFSDDGVAKVFFKKIANEDCITFGTSGLKDEEIENHYQRIPMEFNKVYSAETIVKGELVYYLVKKLFGKHKIKRN